MRIAIIIRTETNLKAPKLLPVYNSNIKVIAPHMLYPLVIETTPPTAALCKEDIRVIPVTQSSYMQKNKLKYLLEKIDKILGITETTRKKWSVKCKYICVATPLYKPRPFKSHTLLKATPLTCHTPYMPHPFKSHTPYSYPL